MTKTLQRNNKKALTTVERDTQIYLTSPYYAFPLAEQFYKTVCATQDLARAAAGLFFSERTDESSTHFLIERARKRREMLENIWFHESIVKIRKEVEKAIQGGRQTLYFEIGKQTKFSPKMIEAIKFYSVKNMPIGNIEFSEGYFAAAFKHQVFYVEIDLKSNVDKPEAHV